MTILQTRRLRLEPVCDKHLEGLYRMNSIPEVMRYISGKPETREDTQTFIDVVKERWLKWGFSWWSFIEIESGEIIGAGCIQHLGRDPANPLEIGWRLHPSKWGQGYASEAAREMALHAFGELKAESLCAVCYPQNTNSSRVMLKLGMHFRGLETWHDNEMATYEMSRADWIAHNAESIQESQ